MSARAEERARERAQERIEKRREQRRKASGLIRVYFYDSHHKEIEGRLIDVSASGFRMAHGDRSLAAGQTVEFAHDEAAGQARVMWNRILDGSVETGFFVIRR
jgi:hypothetical protein